MEQTGFGLVGCGSVADIHARALTELETASLEIAYSRSMENASRVADELGIQATDDWEELVNTESVEVLSICTPSGTHLDYGQRAAEAGFHVVVEKPIEVTVERGRALIDACEEQGVHLSVIFQNRFIPEIREMKEAIERGAIGDVHLADAYVKWFRDQDYYDDDPWKGTLDLDGGGALINQSIHTIDLLQWLAGDVETVFGRTGTFTHEGIDGEDTGVGVVTFEHGGVGVIEGATSVQPAQDRRLEIHGGRGTAVLEDETFTLLTDDDDTGNGDANEPEENEEEDEATGASSPFSGFSIQPHLEQYRDVVGAIQNDRPAAVSGEEALKSLAIVRGIYRSAAEEQPVEIRDLTG